MKTIYGDLIKHAQLERADVILQQCNCFHTMRAGLAKQLRIIYPSVYDADKATGYGDRTKMATFSYAIVDGYRNHKFIVANLYAQYNYGKGLQTDYAALRECLRKIKIQYGDLRIAYPMLGCGLAGGKPDIVLSIIKEELSRGTDLMLIEVTVCHGGIKVVGRR